MKTARQAPREGCSGKIILSPADQSAVLGDDSGPGCASNPMTYVDVPIRHAFENHQKPKANGASAAISIRIKSAGDRLMQHLPTACCARNTPPISISSCVTRGIIPLRHMAGAIREAMHRWLHGATLDPGRSRWSAIATAIRRKLIPSAMGGAGKK